MTVIVLGISPKNLKYSSDQHSGRVTYNKISHDFKFSFW